MLREVKNGILYETSETVSEGADYGKGERRIGTLEEITNLRSRDKAEWESRDSLYAERIGAFNP